MKYKIRIAVAIDTFGEWNSCGFGNVNNPTRDDELMSLALEPVGEGENSYFVECEIEVPETKTIQASVVEKV